MFDAGLVSPGVIDYKSALPLAEIDIGIVKVNGV
jgi:hypothetical protein